MNHDLCRTVLAAVCVLAFAAPALASDYEVLHTFKGSRDGGVPQSALTPDGQGNFYGTTDIGGNKRCGCGGVFRITADHKLTMVYAFKGGKDGANPSAGVTFGPDGALYGTTVSGGNGPNCCGTVFRVTTDGKEKVLYAFAGGSSDGAAPQSGVILDAQGNVFGATAHGGDTNGLGDGTVYKISPDGNETLLHRFSDDGHDGINPLGTLAMDSSGNLYGSAFLGGHSGAGAVFKVTPQGDETILYAFHGSKDGHQPSSDLMIDGSGNLYGTTKRGGDSDFGTVFKLTAAGTKTTLYSFVPGLAGFPVSGVIADGAGNLFGTGTYGFGEVYQLAPDGKFTLLHQFGGGQFGNGPEVGVVSDGLGNLFGTVAHGGSFKRENCSTYGCGMVFRVMSR